MALPYLRDIKDCGNFTLTVLPFIPQLFELPSKLYNIHDKDDFTKLYLNTNPLISAFAMSLVLGYVFVIVSEFNQNFSQVDRMWSILPNFYIMHLAVWARLAGLPTSRLDLVVLFSSIWSFRLTTNYWRRGGYNKGSEDYRWAIIKRKMPSIIWSLFNFIFISFYQSVLLFLFSCVPAYAILLSIQFEPNVQTSDIMFLVAELALVVFEYFSDGQQWTYQTAKHEYLRTKKVPEGYEKADLDRGFNTSGLWGYSRHPNFFAEQSIWIVMYQWSCYASNVLYSWTGTGAFLLAMIFQGSTWLTELISSDKYPEYVSYQKQVGKFFPKTWKRFDPSLPMPTPEPAVKPKVIRTRELAAKQEAKNK